MRITELMSLSRGIHYEYAVYWAIANSSTTQAIATYYQVVKYWLIFNKKKVGRERDLSNWFSAKKFIEISRNRKGKIHSYATRYRQTNVDGTVYSQYSNFLF